jgi:hypothetical protein
LQAASGAPAAARRKRRREIIDGFRIEPQVTAA